MGHHAQILDIPRGSAGGTSHDDDGVTFRYKDYRRNGTGRQQVMRWPPTSISAASCCTIYTRAFTAFATMAYWPAARSPAACGRAARCQRCVGRAARGPTTMPLINVFGNKASRRRAATLTHPLARRRPPEIVSLQARPQHRLPACSAEKPMLPPPARGLDRPQRASNVYVQAGEINAARCRFANRRRCSGSRTCRPLAANTLTQISRIKPSVRYPFVSLMR